MYKTQLTVNIALTGFQKKTWILEIFRFTQTGIVATEHQSKCNNKTRFSNNGFCHTMLQTISINSGSKIKRKQRRDSFR